MEWKLKMEAGSRSKKGTKKLLNSFILNYCQLISFQFALISLISNVACGGFVNVNWTKLETFDDMDMLAWFLLILLHILSCLLPEWKYVITTTIQQQTRYVPPMNAERSFLATSNSDIPTTHQENDGRKCKTEDETPKNPRLNLSNDFQMFPK